MTPSTGSFDRVDYSIRRNKNIERKVVFERLRRLSPLFDFSRYRYIGLGSMWFVDFVLAHRLLDVSTLWSIEKNDAARAAYNKPYSCVTVRGGTSTAVIESMTDEDWKMPVIVWLDYDGRFDADSARDCSTVLKSAVPGSVFLLTVNAHRSTYLPRLPAEQRPKAIEVLRDLFGNAVPANALPSGKGDVGEAEFPQVLSASVLNLFTTIIRNSGRATDEFADRFVPLFDLQHYDGAPMATVGGIIASWRQLPDLENVLNCNVTEMCSGKAMTRDVLDLVPITTKEKLALDQLLPCDEADFASLLEKSGVKLDPGEAQKYRRLYGQFPMFVEAVV
jgi:hypothetical protein